MPISRKPVDTFQTVLRRVNEFIKKIQTRATESTQTHPVSSEIQILFTESNQTDPVHSLPSVDPVSSLTSEIQSYATESNQTEPVPSLTKIQNDLKDIEDLIANFKHWEDDLMKEFISLGQVIGDDHEKNMLENGTQKDINGKLSSIHEKLKSIKKMLPATQTSLKQPVPSETPAQMVSNEWLNLKLEENILVSPSIANLQLSYDVLETQLKLCLLCFTVFPEKAVIKKRPLIHWWIGEGLVTKSKDKTADEVGEEIFEKLVKIGLLQRSFKNKDKNKKSPIVDSCTMHPWIRRMLVPVARRAQFFDFNPAGKIADDYTESNSHRACLVSGNRGLSGITSSNSNSNSSSNPNPSSNSNSNSNSNTNSNSNSTDELLTIFNVDEHYLSFENDLFSKFKKLAILHLGRWQNSAKHHIEVEDDKFLKELQAQKHLRYLSLQGMSRITEIPPSIFECINLEILDLRACHNLETLPDDISRLRKLTHLDVSECYLLEKMPKGLENLSSLQVLKGFVIGHSKKKPDLTKLVRLRKLSIHIGDKAYKHEGELSELKDIVSLRVLTISWKMEKPSEQSSSKTKTGGGRSRSLQRKKSTKFTRAATSTMKPFSLPPNLEKLDLRCFPKPESPEWLKPSCLENLKKLYIRGGDLETLNSETDKKWKVEILRLKYLRNFKIEVSENVFPDLKYFEKFKCNQINESDEKKELPINERRQNDKDVEWEKEEGWNALTAQLAKE
ncbi:disease resistance RPP13-like protein 4 [Cornus florida]|uniref:disease resistance RPP13-like protein 4 n=1 Tax=Cornus florida TaxID=4283 RepID=UPI00289C0CFA|nr:disease resistance RPP13-like protein 4 [Cornus florida]